jgi:hypothetical protein
MARIVVVVPIYKPTLDPLEQFSLDNSLATLAGVPVVFLAPQDLDTRYYQDRYQGRFQLFERSWFSSVYNYNRLLVSEFFYTMFLDYEFMLVLQPDAYVFRNDLPLWVERPFDYIGAPWREGYELLVNLDHFTGDRGKQIRVYVGNGGLSLRRNRKCLDLIREFPEAATMFVRSGSNEDLFFSIMGALSKDFIIPNEITASLFATELNARYYYQVNGNRLPMGTHAWWRWDREFWKTHMPPLPE